MLQTTYRHAKIVNVFLPRFSRFFCLLSSNILKIICLTCIWSKFVDTSFHPSQNPQQNSSRRDRHFYQIRKSLREAQNSPGTGTRHILVHAITCNWLKTSCGPNLEAIGSNAIFLSPRRVSPFSRGMIFTRARVSLALLSLRKNGGLLVV